MMNVKKNYYSPEMKCVQCVLKQNIAGLSLPDVEITDDVSGGDDD